MLKGKQNPIIHKDTQEQWDNFIRKRIQYFLGSSNS